MDNALCGGAGTTLTGAPLAAVKAAIFMGDPHNVAGLPYNVGTCNAKGVSHITLGRLEGTKTLTAAVRRPPQRLQVLAGQPGHHPVVLRLDRPLLLQRQRRQLAPAVRQQVRPTGACLYQEARRRRLSGRSPSAGTFVRRFLYIVWEGVEERIGIVQIRYHCETHGSQEE